MSEPSSSKRRWALLGRLDRYVLVQFLGAYIVAILMIVGLYVVIDVATNLDDYLRKGADGESNIGEVGRYYLLQIPFLYLEVAPFVTLIAGMYSVSRLQKSREVIASLAAGVSARRLLLPIFASSALLAGFMFFLRETACHEIGFERDMLLVQLDEGAEEVVLPNVRLKDASRETITLGRFYPRREPAAFESLLALRLEEGGIWRTYEAASGTWQLESDPVSGLEDEFWELRGGVQEEITDSSKNSVPLVRFDEGLEFSPKDAWIAWKGRTDPTSLSFRQAARLSERDPDNVQYRTLQFYLLSYPLANLVLLLCGLPFLLQYERGKGTEGMVAGFLLCVFYFGTDFVTLNLGMQAQLSPLLATWLAPVFFGSLGLVLFSGTRS